MKKRLKLLATALICFVSVACVFAQHEETYKDVLLNGKPAKLNLATGEITLVTLKGKSDESQVDSIKAKPLLVTNKQVVGGSILSKGISTGTSDFHIVMEGDNLFKLSLLYKTSITKLKEANKLESTLIRKGQKLRVRNFEKLSDNTAVWIVKKGDNLYRIAIASGTTVNAIKSLNGLTSDTIYIGQKLQLHKKH